MRRFESRRSAIAGLAVWERAAEHLHEVLRGEQRIDEAVVTCAQRSG